MLDSVQGRDPCLPFFFFFFFFTFCFFTRTRGLYCDLGFMETIHSRSYTYIIKNLYSNPSEVFDTIIKDEKIEKRTQTLSTQCYDDLITTEYKYQLDKTKVDEYEVKEKIMETLITVNILEGLRFYVSFIL